MDDLSPLFNSAPAAEQMLARLGHLAGEGDDLELLAWHPLPTAWQSLLRERGFEPPFIARGHWQAVLQDVGPQLRAATRMADLLAEAEGGPCATELATAPVLSSWSSADQPGVGLVLVGRVAGYPRQPCGWIRTSPLLGLDQRRGWARTWSRFYLLREPMRPGTDLIDFLSSSVDAIVRPAWEDSLKRHRQNLWQGITPLLALITDVP